MRKKVQLRDNYDKIQQNFTMLTVELNNIQKSIDQNKLYILAQKLSIKQKKIELFFFFFY